MQRRAPAGGPISNVFIENREKIKSIFYILVYEILSAFALFRKSETQIEQKEDLDSSIFFYVLHGFLIASRVTRSCAIFSKVKDFRGKPSARLTKRRS